MNTSNLRKAFLVGTVFVMVGFVSASPVHAQENIFSKIKNGIQGSFESMYLKLPGGKPGAIVLKRMADAMPGMTSATMNAKIAVSSPEVSGFAGSLEITGPFETTDVLDSAAYQQQLNVKGSLTVEGTTMAADADIVVDNKKTYLKLNQAPAIPFVAVGELKDQWLLLDMEESGMMAEGQADAKPTTQVDEATMMAAVTKLVQSSEVSDATREKLDGHGVFALTITIPDAAMEEFQMTMLAASQAENMEEQKAQIKSFLAKTDDFKSNIWVDQNSFYPRQVEVPIVVDVSDADTSAVSALGVSPDMAADVKKVNVTTTIKLDKFNEPVTITVPTNAKPFMEAMTGVMGGAGFMGGMTEEDLMGGSEDAMMLEALGGSNGKMMAPNGTQSVKIEGLNDLPADQKKMIEDYAKQSGVKLE